MHLGSSAVGTPKGQNNIITHHGPPHVKFMHVSRQLTPTGSSRCVHKVAQAASRILCLYNLPRRPGCTCRAARVPVAPGKGGCYRNACQLELLHIIDMVSPHSVWMLTMGKRVPHLSMIAQSCSGESSIVGARRHCVNVNALVHTFPVCKLLLIREDCANQLDKQGCVIGVACEAPPSRGATGFPSAIGVRVRRTI